MYPIQSSGKNLHKKRHKAQNLLEYHEIKILTVIYRALTLLFGLHFDSLESGNEF